MLLTVIISENNESMDSNNQIFLLAFKRLSKNQAAFGWFSLNPLAAFRDNRSWPCQAFTCCQVKCQSSFCDERHLSVTLAACLPRENYIAYRMQTVPLVSLHQDNLHSRICKARSD